MGRSLLCVLLAFVLVACGSVEPSPSTPPSDPSPPRRTGSPLPLPSASPSPGIATPAPTSLVTPAPTDATANAVWTSPIATSPGTYLEVLTGSSEFLVSALASTADGGKLVAGSVRGSPPGLLLVKLRDDGQVAWQRILSAAPSKSATKSTYWHAMGWGESIEPSIATTDDGGAAVAFDDLLVRIDRDGAVLWTKAYVPEPAGDYVLLTSVVAVEGGFLLAGEIWDLHDRPPEALGSGVVLVRTDAEGDAMWMRRHPGYGVSIRHKASPDHVLPMARLVIGRDGQPVLGTFQTVPNPARNDPHWLTLASGVRVVTADVDLADGSLGAIHAFQVESPAGCDLENPPLLEPRMGFQAMAAAPNGDLIVAHGVQDGRCFNSGNGHWTVVTRLSPAGEVVWSQRLAGGYEPNGEVEIRSIAFAGEDLILAGSTTEFLPFIPYERHQNLMLARATGGGEIEWLRAIGVTRDRYSEGPSLERGVGVTTGRDGAIFVAGFADSFSTDGRNDLVFIRAGSNGAFVGDGELANLGDFGDPWEATWAPAPIETFSGEGTAGEAIVLAVEQQVPTSTVPGFLPETVRSGCATRSVTLLDHGKTLRSTCSIFVDPKADAARDPDGDGIDQGFENAALALTSPRVEVDEEEDWLAYRARYGWLAQVRSQELHHAAIFTRVFPWPSRSDVRYILVLNAVAWSYDYGAGLTSTPILSAEDHRGDSEKIFEAWRVVDGHRLRLEWVQTSAHDGITDHTGTWSVRDPSCNRGGISDFNGGYYGTELLCGKVRFGGDRVLVQTSEDKHAMYLTTEICKAVSLIWDVWGENCGWNPSKIPIISLFQWKEKDFAGDPQYVGRGVWQLNAYNVGEPDQGHRLINDLGEPTTWYGVTEAQREALTGLFPGESIWDGNLVGEGGFCGGLSIDGLDYFAHADKCSGTIGEKFVLSTSSAGDRQLTAKLDSYYRVSITTGKGPAAGTDPSPWITLVGDAGRQSTFVLDGAFDAGGKDVFYLPPSTTYGGGGTLDTPVGVIRAVKLRLVVGAADPDWLVTGITVTTIASGATWTWTSKDGRWVRAGTPEDFVANPEE